MFGRRGAAPAPPPACPTCAQPLDAHDRHVRFGLPDPLVLAPQEVRDTMWRTEIMIQAEGHGAFVRALLPVRLTGGYTVTYGLWLGVHPQEMHRALAAWHAPTYPDLVLDGVLGNSIGPWGLLGTPACAVVRDPDHTPYVDSSPHPLLSRVLHDDWPHDDVLPTLPG
jgi:hypothetical protein